MFTTGSFLLSQRDRDRFSMDLFLFSSTFDLLRAHYRTDHYFCEIGDCKDVQFTNVFASELEFRAHQATQHSKSRAEARQLGTIPVEFQSSSVRDRRQQRDTNRGNVNDLSESWTSLVVSQNQTKMEISVDKTITIRRGMTGKYCYYSDRSMFDYFAERRINVKVAPLLLLLPLPKSRRLKNFRAWAIELPARRARLNNVARGQVRGCEESIPTRIFLRWPMEQ